MSATLEVIQKFIELRADNISYEKIAKELKVSKTTLIKWAKDYQLDIDNLRAISYESLNEQYKASRKHRLAMWSEQLEAIQNELKARGLKDIPTAKLIELLDSLSEKVKDSSFNVGFNSPEYPDPFTTESVAFKKRDHWTG